VYSSRVAEAAFADFREKKEDMGILGFPTEVETVLSLFVGLWVT
jgi:hypothetical protein